jgi:hypothetical protein
MILVLCVASVTYSFIYRHREGDKPRMIRVEVLNGTGERGIAHEAKRGLSYLGIDVISVGNADRSDYAESVLIARRPGVEIDRLGELIGCGNAIVQVRRGALEDATLILGQDYRSLRLDWTRE